MISIRGGGGGQTRYWKYMADILSLIQLNVLEIGAEAGSRKFFRNVRHYKVK